jgi:hypothetical protein
MNLSYRLSLDKEIGESDKQATQIFMKMRAIKKMQQLKKVGLKQALILIFYIGVKN